jgi:hypothetical protein
MRDLILLLIAILLFQFHSSITQYNIAKIIIAKTSINNIYYKNYCVL